MGVLQRLFSKKPQKRVWSFTSYIHFEDGITVKVEDITTEINGNKTKVTKYYLPQL